MYHFKWVCLLKNVLLGQVKQTIMKEINSDKAPGNDLISETILQELSVKGIKLISYIILNPIFSRNHFPRN